MNVSALIDSLDRFGWLLPSVVGGISSEDSLWRPADNVWSIVEVVAHLNDEEEFDFPIRLQLTLSDPQAPWPAIDPPAWAIERRYRERQLTSEATRFSALRHQFVSWLRSLSDVNWGATHVHPQFGPISAGELLAGWAAHDQLHLRQIAKRQFQLVQRDAGTFSTRYAGDWTV